MSRQPVAASPAMRWAGWSIASLSLPLLYLLSVPWIYLWTTSSDFYLEHLAAMERFNSPYLWLTERPPLDKLLLRYWKWCEDMVGPRPPVA